MADGYGWIHSECGFTDGQAPRRQRSKHPRTSRRCDAKNTMMFDRCWRYRVEWRRYPAVMAAAAAVSQRRFIRTCGARVRRSLSAVSRQSSGETRRNVLQKKNPKSVIRTWKIKPQICRIKLCIVRRRRRLENRDNDYRRARPKRRRGHLRDNVVVHDGDRNAKFPTDASRERY